MAIRSHKVCEFITTDLHSHKLKVLYQHLYRQRIYAVYSYLGHESSFHHIESRATIYRNF